MPPATSAQIEAIVRRVVSQCLSAEHAKVPAGASLDLSHQRVVTIRDLQGKLDGAKNLIVAKGAVISPAARDLLRASGIQIAPVDASCVQMPAQNAGRSAGETAGKTADPASNHLKQTDTGSVAIADADAGTQRDGSGLRADAFAKQLQLRTGITVVNTCSQVARIVLAQLPQVAVAECWRNRREAIHVGSINEAKNVLAQMNPEVWVLDMQRLNLIAAVNVAQVILRGGSDRCA